MTRGSYFCIEWSGKVSPRRCEPRGGGWEGSYDEVREESFAGNGESDCKGRRREQAWPGERHAGKVGAVRVQRGRAGAEGGDVEPAECGKRRFAFARAGYR